MNKHTQDIIKKVSMEIVDNYRNEPLFSSKKGKIMPERKQIIDVLLSLRDVMFPGYFQSQDVIGYMPEYFVGERLGKIHQVLSTQVRRGLNYMDDQAHYDEDNYEQAEEIVEHFVSCLPDIQKTFLGDIQMLFDGDPAAQSKEEIIFSYPGLFAIYVYRIAHEFYLQKVPFIPRIMTEYAHGKTGIDINAGATIGKNFFIDHGTGIVIGETTEIGDNVKLYQGVTLGGLSTRKGQGLSGSKRHPTIGNNVTIYAGATILGGNTIIGENSVIGGNAFITDSVPANSRISIKSPEKNLRFDNIEK